MGSIASAVVRSWNAGFLRNIRLSGIVGLLALALSGPSAAEPGFVAVEALDAASNDSNVTDLSDDGVVAVGWSDSNEGVRATRWTAADGSVSLGSWFMPQPGDRHSEAMAISGDGSTVVGWSRVSSIGAPLFPDRRIAFQWTESGGFDVYPLVGPSEAVAEDVSYDGSTIVGFQRSSATNSFSVRFVDGASPIPVGLPCCNPFVTSRAAAVSADGSRITGSASYISFGGVRVSYLTGASLQLIGSTTSGETVSASALTADGTRVVGHRNDGQLPDTDDVFQWTESEGFTLFGTYPSALATRVNAVSADGATMVGWASPPEGERAILWRGGQGFDLVSDLATAELGLDLSGWTLLRANSITPDGNAIAGDGINPSGVEQGWILYFDAPLAPAVPGAGVAFHLILAGAIAKVGSIELAGRRGAGILL